MTSVVDLLDGGGCLRRVAGPLHPSGAISVCPSEDTKPSPMPEPFGVRGTGLASGLRWGFGLRGAMMPSSFFLRFRKRRTERMSNMGSKTVLMRLWRGGGGGRIAFWVNSVGMALGVDGMLASPGGHDTISTVPIMVHSCDAPYAVGKALSLSLKLH